MRRFSLYVAGLFLFLPLFFGTGGGCSDADEFLDCVEICDSYQDCIDDNFDSGACTDRCEDRADDDDDFANDVNVCEACLEGRSCQEGWEECEDICTPVVE